MQSTLTSLLRVHVALFLALLLAAHPLYGQAPGSPDPSFKTGSTLDAPVNAVAVAADGKIYIGGGFTTVGGMIRNRIARLNPDGTVDESFNPGLGPDRAVNSIAIAGDGKVVVVGEFYTFNGTQRLGIARLNKDGSLDTAFNPALLIGGTINTFALQADGKILVGGKYFRVLGYPLKSIARLNADGSLDYNFFASPDVDGEVHSIAIQGDGRVIIGGSFFDYGIFKIARLNPNGALDSTFSRSGGFSGGNITTIVAQTDGKVLIAGGPWGNQIARLDGSGIRDTSFNPGTGFNAAINSIVLQKDGKLLVGGAFHHFNGTLRIGIARLNTDGSLDPTFDPAWGSNPGNPRVAYTIAMQGSEKLIVGGEGLVRLNGTGSRDAGFDSSSGANGSVSCAAVHADGKVLIGGDFVRYSGVSRRNVARINPDGSLDLSFDPGLGASAFGIESLAVQPNGKVLVGGAFTSFNGVARSGIARLNSDGSLDGGFALVLGGAQSVSAIAAQPDGKVLIGGLFNDLPGSYSRGLARLNSDGSLDASFNMGSGPDSDVASIVVLGDGKVLIAGGFGSYNSTLRKGIARLNNDGSLDTTFDPGAGADKRVHSVAIQGDGKIIIAGDFSTFNNTACKRVARLNADGSLDTTFDAITGANNSSDGVYALALQGDGKILVGGYFSVSEPTRKGLLRLNSDGSVDETFDPGSGVYSGSIDTIALQEDGKAIIGGAFPTYNGMGHSFVARLFCGPPMRKLGTVNLTQVIWRREGSVPNLPNATFELSSDGGLSWSPLGEGTRIGNSGNWQLSGLALPASGLLRARCSVASGYGNEGASTVEQVEPISLVTATPTLVAPADGTGSSSLVNVSFTLPEAALPGSVKLSFGAIVLTLGESQAGAGSHSFTFDPAQPTASVEIASGEPIPDGTYTVTLRYQDLLGHTEASASAIGVVLDHAPPELIVPADITLTASGANGAVVTYPPATATDALTANPSITYSRASGTVFPLGITVVTVTSSDGMGNVSNKTFTVTVQPSTDADLATLDIKELALVPAFDPATTTYRMTVGSATKTATLTAAPAFAGATIALTSGTPINLSVGVNDIPVVVTAQDGSTKTYHIAIKRLPADSMMPFVTITAPTARVASDTFTASGFVYETVGLAKLTVSLNGAGPIPVPIAMESGEAIPWSLEGLVPENGKNMLVVKGTDFDGNVGAAAVSFTYINPKFAGMAGVYNAILVPSGTPTAMGIGLVTVAVSNTGTFTVKAKLPGITGTAKGILHNNGTAHFQFRAGMSSSMPLGAAGDMVFSVNPEDGLAGTVGAAMFAGEIAPYSGKQLVPATPYLNQPAVSSKPPTRGVYNLAVRRDNHAAGMPSGDGYASVKISNSGSVTLSGYLADGTKLSAATKLRADGTAPIFAPLYGNKGGFSTNLVFADQDDTDVLGEDSTWIRPVGKPGSRVFPAGWPSGLGVEVFGTHWNGVSSIDLGQAGSNPAVGNAMVTFEDGALSNSMDHAIDLHPVTGKVKVVPVAGTACRLSVNAATGMFSGTFSHTDGTKPRYRGVLINKGANRAGYGYFLSAPAIGAPSQGGRVILEPQSLDAAMAPR